mmetsp:Transcript_31330/g.60519  ORF Transcript_31330/g.60519 Transcript_31330/m.60519 type:complete len:116 (-) Transcript_31330:56-403(-)
MFVPSKVDSQASSLEAMKTSAVTNARIVMDYAVETVAGGSCHKPMLRSYPLPLLPLWGTTRAKLWQLRCCCCCSSGQLASWQAAGSQAGSGVSILLCRHADVEVRPHCSGRNGDS